jgi:hypothetical protein
MICESCGKQVSDPTIAPLWSEYRVGSIDSPERFYLCPACDRETDPIALWAEQAEATEIHG